MINRNYIALFATCAVFLLLYILGVLRFPGFNSLRVLTNLLTDNAFLVVTALGMTFVIISGGIDLSVGSVIACTGIISAALIEHQQMHPLTVFPIVILIGTSFGAFMGCLIHFFSLPPFIVTLAGMFFARGACFVISIESIPITHPFYDSIADFYIELPDNGSITVSSIILLVVMIGSIVLAHYTKFGRNVYAIGGNESSAVLLGIPIGKTKIMIYALSGFLASLAGVVFTFYTFSGYSLAAEGLELDAIAAVVIGGTLLTGGVGYVVGTLIGVMILGLIQTFITFDGTLSSWWTRIFIGILLFIFISLQTIVSRSVMLKQKRA